MMLLKENASGVNLTYLENICGDDNEFIKKVVETYLSQIPEFLNNIELALKNADYKLLASMAHKIRSSSQFMGAFNIVDLSEQIERKCKELQQDANSKIQLENLASKILLQFQDMKPELQGLLGVKNQS